MKNCCNNLEFLSKRLESDQKDKVGGEFEIVYVRARKQSDIEFNYNWLVVIDTNLILASQSRFLRLESERKTIGKTLASSPSSTRDFLVLPQFSLSLLLPLRMPATQASAYLPVFLLDLHCGEI